jgi:hypothetical protein
MGMLGTGYNPIANWIRDEKHLLSQGLGRDVGVPLTVDFLISRAHSLKIKYEKTETSDPNPPSLNTMESILLADANNDNIASREVWINTYFFGSNYCEVQESQGSSPLEGELKRYAASIRKIPVKDVVLTEYEVCEYARAHKLDDSFKRAACKKLRI